MTSDDRKSTRLRAILKNAVVWGVTWGALGTVWASIMRINDNIALLRAIGDGIGMGIRIGFMGALTGAAFSAFISVAYRGKRLSEINWLKFGLGTAAVTGAFVPLFLQTMNVLSGQGMVPWHLVLDDFLFSALFGGITAAGTMRIAQHDEAKHPVTVQQLLDQMERSITAGEATAYPAKERSRSTQY